MTVAAGLALAERGLLPDRVTRAGIRRLLAARLAEAERGPGPDAAAARLAGEPVAPVPDAANRQHYEVPAEFFAQVLGPHLKYSGAYWPPETRTLEAAEAAMLALTAERAGLADGQRILELGCGWGSLALWMARRFPRARIVAVSNSAPQRRFIEARAPGNLEVVTADMNTFRAPGVFDRVVSVEMFEHMRNWPELLRRVASWLTPDGKLFVHVFCHRRYTYPFRTTGPDNWMGRYFFTGGMMPGADLLSRFGDDLTVEAQWMVPGGHYARTAEAWLANLDARRDAVWPVLASTYGPEARRWFHRWRLFFLACAECFAFGGGAEWQVAHYRLTRRHS